MVLTALQCRQIGITYASVHDSYWTHASTVNHMSEIIRDTFVKLHCEEILKRLRDEFVERYKGYRIPLSSLGAKADKENPKLVSMLQPSKSKKTKKSKLSKIEDEENEENEENEEDNSNEISLEDLNKLKEINKNHLSSSSDNKDGKKSDEIDLLNDSKVSDLINSKYVKLEDALPDLPQKGPFDVRGVVNSPYFFS